MDLKANKVDITPSSVSTTKLIANEWNQLVTENMNVITTGGELTPSSKDRKQMVASIEKISEDKTKEVMFENYDIEEPWQKPADWIDIRNVALPNSVYFLVGHKADFSQYRYLGFTANLSNASNNFKVYIDYNLYGTYVSGSTVQLDWQSLNLSTGSETTFPTQLKTHILRITPENSEDTIQTYIASRGAESGNEPQCILWIHFALTNSLERVKLCNYSNPQLYQPNLVAITAVGNNLHFSGDNLTGFLGNTADRYSQRSNYLAHLPTLEVDSVNYIGGMLNHGGNLKKAKIIVNNMITAKTGGNTSNSTSFASGNLEEIDINKPIIIASGSSSNQSLFRVSNLRKLPPLDFSSATNLANFITTNGGLKDTILDLTDAKNLARVAVNGTTTTRMLGLKGVVVSNESPFNGTSPQINVSYTGLDRSALVNLFNSMPTVSESQVCNITGATGAVDLTAEDLAIATNKGWTITR